MPYPLGHRNEVKKKIVQSARRLFNRHGFDGVSLEQIMAGAGLTHGWFYSYFASKSDLYVEVLGCFFTDPEWKSCWEGVEVDLSAGDEGPQVVKAYLSRQHFEDVENSCPMTALPTNVARSSVSTKRAFGTVFRAMVKVLERSTNTGVRVADLLAKMGVPLGRELRGIALGSYLVVVGSDGYGAAIALAEVDPSFHTGEVIVADTMNGQPLDARSGPFKLVLTEDKRPARWVRNLIYIELKSAW
jgi:AcrR family transcriptional regulator